MTTQEAANNKRYSCSHCQFQSDSIDDFEPHKRLEHNNEPIVIKFNDLQETHESDEEELKTHLLANFCDGHSWESADAVSFTKHGVLDIAEYFYELGAEQAHQQESGCVKCECVEALIRCYGLADFVPEGKARKGWEKIVQPLLTTKQHHTTMTTTNNIKEELVIKFDDHYGKWIPDNFGERTGASDWLRKAFARLEEVYKKDISDRATSLLHLIHNGHTETAINLITKDALYANTHHND